MKNWILKKAKWFQFWLPQSGIIGGIIFGAVLLISFILLMAAF